MYELSTITEICNDYLTEKRERRKPDTVYGYESSINRHVLPRWGALRVSEITRKDVQAWVDELTPLRGPSGAEKAYKCLRQIIRWAIDEGLEAIDPTRRIEITQKPQEPLNTLTQRRLKKLIRGFVGHLFEPTLILQSALGLRPSENYYLSWESIDWRTGAVEIKGALLQIPGLVYESTTKTRKSTRTLYLPQWAIDRLHTIWVERGRPKGRIIGNAKPMRVAWAIKLHAIKNRLPWVGMRNLRHTWATLAIKAGAAIEHVAEMMGHSNIQTCYRYYMEITAATKRRVQRRLARLVLGKSCDDMYKGIIPPQPAPQPARDLPMAA